MEHKLCKLFVIAPDSFKHSDMLMQFGLNSFDAFLSLNFYEFINHFCHIRYKHSLQTKVIIHLFELTTFSLGAVEKRIIF